jgi:hypothetical protein
MAVKFKMHETPESHTKDVVIRVSTIDNGFVIKAGGPPRHVASVEELKSEVGELLSQFAGQVAPKKKRA